MTRPSPRPPHRRPARLRALAALAVLTAALAASGCFNPFAPRLAPELGFSKTAPVPSTPTGVLRLFEWCYNNKAIVEYTELFTDDYRFYFSPLDSAGQEYRSEPWTREHELQSAENLFLSGSAELPPANSIRLQLDKNFFVFPDPTYAQTDPLGVWHKNISTQVVLNIQTADGNTFNISGAANFYLVRGDLALIPLELQKRGFGPDPNRWYIRRWDDETAVPGVGGLAATAAADARLGPWRPRAAVGPAPDTGRRSPTAQRAAPGGIASWGSVKVHYLAPVMPTAARARRGP